MSHFLQWISSKSLTLDFENMKSCLSSGYPEISSFVPNFLTGSKLPFFDSKGNKIPCFYSKAQTSFPVPFKEMYSPNHKVDKISLARILLERYKIPEFFSFPLMLQINPRSIQSHHEYVRFSSLIPLGEILDSKQERERIFYLLLFGRNRDYLIADDFGFYVVRYIQTNHKFDLYKKNTNECSIFSRYILMNLVLVFDPEFRGKITRQQFLKHDFIQVLDEISDFEKFKEIYSLFDELDIQKKGSLSFEEVLLYDHRRVHSQVLSRIWKFLPGNKINDRITFGDFVVYVLLLEFKESEAALNFWFKVCDIEEDGILSLNEMSVWYHLQKQMLKAMNSESEKFKQLVPQIMDMMGSNATQWTRSQIKESGAWPRLYNILIDPKLFYGYFLLREDMAITN